MKKRKKRKPNSEPMTCERAARMMRELDQSLGLLPKPEKKPTWDVLPPWAEQRDSHVKPSKAYEEFLRMAAERKEKHDAEIKDYHDGWERRRVAVWQAACIRAVQLQREALITSRTAYLSAEGVGALNESAKKLRKAANLISVVAFEVRRHRGSGPDPYFKSALEREFPVDLLNQVFDPGAAVDRGSPPRIDFM